ncbi:MAG: mechanosensitive ion channel domain-containing protein [Pseudomarimonas sp.]
MIQLRCSPLIAVLFACVMGAGSLGVGSCRAAEPLPASAAPDIERARASIERGPLSETQSADAKAALDAASGFEDQALLAEQAMTALRDAVAIAAREKRTLERSLADSSLQSFRAWRQALPADIAGEQLEERLASERADVLRLTAEVGDLRQTLGGLSNDTLSAIEQQAELQLQVDALKRRVESPSAAAGDEPLALQQAQQALLKAELRARSVELALHVLERDTAPARRVHAELALRHAQRELGEREQRVKVLQALSATRQSDAMQAMLERLQTQVERHADSDALLKVAAATSLTMGRSLAATSAALTELRDGELARVNARDAVAGALRDTQARLAVEGQDDSLGPILVLERRRLGSPDVIQRRLDEVRQALSGARLQQIALADQRTTLADLPSAVAEALQRAEGSSNESHAVELRAGLYELLGERAELLPQLDSAIQRYIAALELAESNLQAQLVDTRTLGGLLDRRIYWIPSNPSIDGEWFGRLGEGWADLLKPARFVTSGKLALARISAHPTLPILLGIIGLALLVFRSRALALIETTLPPLRRPAEDNFVYTWKALGITVAAALSWAVWVFGLGLLLRASGEPGRFSDSLGRALISVSSSLFLLEFLRFLVVEHGLAHLHFRWMRARRDAIRATLPIALFILLPLQFLIVLALARSQELAIDTAARCALVAFCVVVGVQLYRLLGVGGIWTTRGGPSEPRRLRQILRIGLSLLFATLAVLILAGYVYSGAIIVACLWATLGTVVAVGVLHGLFSRWFLLGERHLALNRMEARRAVAALEAVGGGSDEGAAGITEEALALETVNVQTGRLLRAVTLALWVGGLFWVWSDVLPALGRLDDVVLWNVTNQAADGTAISEAVSLKAVLFGLLTLALMVVASRNLPGLLELGVLSRTSIDPASRYAITTMSRYAIVIVGAVIGFGLLGLRWSQLQWMAAALTVGLGFGLQEIFANFVSGLILLSERPFRVGDVITIADQTGTVTRISTRATTLMDFDGKELIVPNKTFITDRLVNWTLSDTETRLVLKLGVSYETSPDAVHALLQQVATEHPLVLTEPPPRSWFMGFGASSLDFELRVFVATISDRLPVMNELNGRIANLCRERDIVIAFPQMDVNLRRVPTRSVDGTGPIAADASSGNLA